MFKASCLLVAALALAGCVESSDLSFDEEQLDSEQSELFGFGSHCWRPVRAVLSTLACIENEDPECAAAGYSPDFVKLHNGVDTNTVISGPEFWAGAFSLIDLSLDIDHLRRTGRDQVSIRYVETVSFITGDVFYQHEHALVTVDGDCKMTLWDQYGDNQEQQAVDDKVAEIISGLGNPQP